MRSSTIAIAVCLSAIGAAQPQRFDDRRGVAGTYTDDQFRDRIHRVLILGRDGDFELNTTYNGRDRGDMSRDEVKRFGTAAEKARKTGRPVRHLGRWDMDGRRIRLRMEDVIGDLKGSEKFDVDLDWRNDAFVFDKNTEVYGTETINFRGNNPWSANRPPRPGGGRPGNDDRPNSRPIGSANYNGRRLRLDRATLSGSNNSSRLIVWLEGQRLEFTGKLEGRGDRATFFVDRSRGTSGTFKLELRNNDIRSISGSGYSDYKVILLSD